MIKCSRSNNAQKTHYCAVTLLRRPPGPTVMVTAAHCTFLCKSNDVVVDNCCCENVSGVRCQNETAVSCGTNPSVVEMTGKDVEVICGEWEIGDATKEDSKEEYNVIFNVKNINRHPDFGISRGVGKTQYVANDIATIHTDEKDPRLFNFNKIYPACIPEQKAVDLTGKYGIHSGWSTPPPLSYLSEFVPLYLPYYRDFRKQWHYNMEFTECRDPTFNEVTGRCGDRIRFISCQNQNGIYFCSQKTNNQT